MKRIDPTCLYIGRSKQLFVDDVVLESVENLCRTWHQPVKTDESPLLSKDQPWEHVTYFSCNTWQLIRDPKDSLFKCWYTDWDYAEVGPHEVPPGQSRFSILYAESDDGIHWRKPTLDVHQIDGRGTNVVLADAYNLGLVIDPHERDQSQRFKGIYTEYKPGGDVTDLVAATSGDGIHWTSLSQPPVIGRSGLGLDDVVILSYDPLGRLFVLNTRHYNMHAVARNLNNPVVGHFTPPYYPLDWHRMNKRRVWQSESADLIHWREPYPILTPEDGLDDLDETFYGMCQYPVGNITLGLLNTFNYVPNTMGVRLVYSRDGKTWQHLNKRQPFLAPGGEGAWDAHMVTIPSRPIEVGDELYVYHGGSSNHHDWWMTGAREGVKVREATDLSAVNYALGLAKLRLDGFVSLTAGPVRPGILVTRPLLSDGTRLVANASCGTGGSIAAEIVDIRDEVLPGFSRTECDLFRGDAVRHAFSWQGKTEIPVGPAQRAEYPQPEVERFRKIRFYMENAELYTFRLANGEPEG